MQAHITHADGQGRCLWDVTFEDEMNPFTKCCVDLAALQRSGTSGRLRPIFEFFVDEHRLELLSVWSQMIGGIIAQVEWRFKEFKSNSSKYTSKQRGRSTKTEGMQSEQQGCNHSGNQTKHNHTQPEVSNIPNAFGQRGHTQQSRQKNKTGRSMSTSSFVSVAGRSIGARTLLLRPAEMLRK